MQWLNDIDKKYAKVSFSLRDLRVAKGLSQLQVAQILKISHGLYNTIESGHRKPSADVLFKLSMIYKTSMDFIYHAFYRQHYIWNYPDRDLKYALKEAAEIDMLYIYERVSPEAPPEIPEVFIFEPVKNKVAANEIDEDMRIGEEVYKIHS